MDEPELIAESEEQELFEHHHFVADKGQGLLRIDKWLMMHVANATRSKIQSAAEAGCILVNGKAVKSSYKIKPADVVSIVLAHPPRLTEIIPEDIPINIVFEDANIIVVNKNPGMVVHPGFANYTGTLVHALAWHLRGIPAPDGNPLRPGLVHRIDKNTSGLLVVAKTDLAMAMLAKEFFEHTIDRAYYALVWGDFVEDEGTVDVPIGRDIRDRRIMSADASNPNAKNAITHFKVIERFGYVTLIECRLETGRTHQIRAHMKYLGHPLFNDETYGGDKILRGTTFSKYRQFVDNCFKLMPRQALHARLVGFVSPTTKQKIVFEAGLPNDFHSVIYKWRKYAAKP